MNKRIVVDTNILLDYLLMREPYYKSARLLMLLGYIKELDLWIGSSQITDMIYVLSNGGKHKYSEKVRNIMKKLMQMISIYATNDDDFSDVANSSWDDLEDAFVYQTAKNIKANYIVTRNHEDFVLSDIEVISCQGLFEKVESTGRVFDEVALI